MSRWGEDAGTTHRTEAKCKGTFLGGAPGTEKSLTVRGRKEPIAGREKFIRRVVRRYLEECQREVDRGGHYMFETFSDLVMRKRGGGGCGACLHFLIEKKK